MRLERRRLRRKRSTASKVMHGQMLVVLQKVPLERVKLLTAEHEDTVAHGCCFLERVESSTLKYKEFINVMMDTVQKRIVTATVERYGYRSAGDA